MRYEDRYHNGNPPYPDLGPAVAKFRRLALGGIAALSREERRAYGEAVGKAILAKQRSEAHSGLPPANPKARCVSGTYFNNGADIHDAILRRQRSALLSAPAKIRRQRTAMKWEALYERAMIEKRARQQTQAA